MSAGEETEREGQEREGKGRREMTFATKWFGPSSSEEDSIAIGTRNGESGLVRGGGEKKVR